MTPLEITLIVIGALILIISFFLVNKEKEIDYAALTNQRELSLMEIDSIKEKVQTIISAVTEESVTLTEDQLSRISNEKIIAVNDFSSQVMEKISQNHEEVVFLYNMLNEKENEIKDTVNSFDKIKKQLNDITKDITKNETDKKKMNMAKNNNRSADRDNLSDKANLDVDSEHLNNHNQKILEMYSQGFSVIDIARTLELGQGEVKLVLDLFKDK